MVGHDRHDRREVDDLADLFAHDFGTGEVGPA
jgi:hypothetical protein